MGKAFWLLPLLGLLAYGGWIVYDLKNPVFSEVVVETLVVKGDPVVVSKRVKAGEVVVNDTDYPAQVIFGEQRVRASLKPKTRALLPKVERQRGEDLQFEIFSGNVRFDVKKTAVQQSFRIATPSAVAGVRGTKFNLMVQPDALVVKLPEGRLALEPSVLGESRELEAGQKTSVHLMGVDSIVQMSQEELAWELREYEEHRFAPSALHHYELKLLKVYGHPLYIEKQRWGLHVSLKGNFKVKDLTPLKEIPMNSLDISNTNVTDLTPLEGRILRELNLEGTPLEDLSSLETMTLQDLYLGGTRVSDLSPLSQKPLRVLTLWGTQVEDLTPLRRMPLHWLSLNDTKVMDLSPLEEAASLKTLSIFSTDVQDLAPIREHRLETLLISPERLGEGWHDVVEGLHSLRVLGENDLDLKVHRRPRDFLLAHPRPKRKPYRPSDP